METVSRTTFREELPNACRHQRVVMERTIRRGANPNPERVCRMTPQCKSDLHCGHRPDVGRNTITQTKNILINENMNLHEYYRTHKDAINASIMEIACDLAVGRLLSTHDTPFETFVEADDPDDPDSGTHYKEEFQKEYDTYYDEEYARVAKLMRFDHCQDDGVAASSEDTNV